MTLKFTKHQGKNHVIHYIRDNGTTIWAHSDDFFILHDLSHYVIEKVLGYKTAFYGIINGGATPTDFEDSEKKKSITMTHETYNAESMANLFLLEISQGNFDDFNMVQQQSLYSINNQYLSENLTDEQIHSIRSYLRSLIKEWNLLPAGHSIELEIAL